MAEVIITGQLLSAHGFPPGGVFCKFSFEAGSNFRVLQGKTQGQTHCDTPFDGEMAVLAHPLDVHYALKGVDGWPRLQLEVFGVDIYGRIELLGYGCAIVPTTAGTHEVRCSTWRPCGSMREQFSTYFLGGVPRLKHKELIATPVDRFRLQTEPSGDIHLSLSVVPKDFARYGVIC